VRLFDECVLILPKPNYHEDNTKDPEKPEFDWRGEHTAESLIDNKIYSPAVRNTLLLSEIGMKRWELSIKNLRLFNRMPSDCTLQGLIMG
jgi:hypothetical protein